MRIVFAAGGTGGHLYPAVAIAKEAERNGAEIFFLTSTKGLEKEILTKYGYKFYEQEISAFVGAGIIAKTKSIFKLIRASFKALQLIDKNDKILLMGGFVSAPVAVAAKLKGAEIYLHEQNSKMGLVNRLFAKSAKKVFLSFDIKDMKIKNSIITHNPIRDEFYKIELKDYYEKKILVIGGSQGSRIINTLIVSSIDDIINNGYTVTHMTGKKLYDEVINAYGSKIKKYSKELKVVAYIDDIAESLDDHDIVISRSGSGAVFEILAAKRLAIFIPFKKAALNHQYLNALDVVGKREAVMILEDELCKDKLFKSIAELESSRKTYQSNLKNREIIHSAKVIASEVLS